MKNRSLILGLLGILLLACGAASASERQFLVSVSVPIKNEFTDRVKSFVIGEFRELPDIKLVDNSSHENGQYLISIVAVPLKLESAGTVGVAVSYVFQDGDSIAHGVLTGSPDDLKGLCEALVSNFDIAFVEPNRGN